MTVELIPVLEITMQDIGSPDRLYLRELSFYKISGLSDDELAKLTKEHTEDFRIGKYTREDVSAFFGGYILRINQEDKFFPQCCGDLSDISFWEKVANGKENAYYEGHPSPKVKIKKDLIIFDLSVSEFEEPFKPEPSTTIVEVDKGTLKNAIEKAKEELNIFSDRLLKINMAEHLEIEDIDKLLVWGNP
jgi:hypothetical protein